MIYFLAFILSIIGITLCLYSQSKWIKYGSRFIFFFLTGLEFLYLQLNKTGLSYEDVLLVQQNLGFNLHSQALLTFKQEIIYAVFISLLFILLVIAIDKLMKPQFNKRYSLLYLFSIAIVYLVIDKSQANRLAFPGATKTPALYIYSLTKSLYVGPRDLVSIQPEKNSEIDHIIWVIDESVRSDHLGINGYNKETTPFLTSLNNSNLINLGHASSAAVCSDYSHYVMITGTRASEIPAHIENRRVSPLIFQYATKAQYKPMLIYSPGYEDIPQGYLTKFDFEHIPIRINTAMNHPELKRHNHDFKSIEYLAREIEKEEKTFSYFLKYGCHFHYEDAYPKDQTFYHPTQDPRDWTMTNKEATINSYDNAIRWSVDKFMNQLLDTLKDKRFLIIYTSDHGQNILDHPEIKLTHCIKDKAPKVMAAVPMILLGDSITIASIQNNYSLSSKSSHFDIFPSTLSLLGYNDQWVRTNYESLGFLDTNQKPRYYFSGDIFGRSKCFKNEFD